MVKYIFGDAIITAVVFTVTGEDDAIGAFFVRRKTQAFVRILRMEIVDKEKVVLAVDNHFAVFVDTDVL